MQQRKKTHAEGKRVPRRRFIRDVVAAGAAVEALSGSAAAQAQPAGGIRGFDHVALPMQNTEAMLAFYRGLGLEIAENAQACSVYVGNQMINFHRPALWQRETFTLRAPAAKPPCGDLCFVWEGAADSLKAMLDRAGAKVIEGPVARQGGRKAAGVERLRARPGRQPAGVHHLLRSGIGELVNWSSHWHRLRRDHRHQHGDRPSGNCRTRRDRSS